MAREEECILLLQQDRSCLEKYHLGEEENINDDEIPIFRLTTHNSSCLSTIILGGEGQ
jgi:hypothetical protein